MLQILLVPLKADQTKIFRYIDKRRKGINLIMDIKYLRSSSEINTYFLSVILLKRYELFVFLLANQVEIIPTILSADWQNAFGQFSAVV